MKKGDNAVNILASLKYKGIGNAWVAKNLQKITSIEVIVELISDKLKERIPVNDFIAKRESVRRELANIYYQTDGFGITAIGDSDFPQVRGSVKDADEPVVLFYKGNLELIQKQNKNIAVIGVLNPDTVVERKERQVVTELVKSGYSIVSGLALGCDSIAHTQTLQSNGHTIAILPSPLNQILPKTNLPLARQIVDNNGLLVTEYYTQVTSKYELGSHYVRRDRLQALFSDFVILSASYAENSLGYDCGSRHAMGKAKEYGIPRGVIYNALTDLNNPMYDLSRQIIKIDSDTVVIEDSKESIRNLINLLNQNIPKPISSLF